MKIAIVTSTLPPYAGGIGNVAAWNAVELAKLGHEVTIFTPHYAAVTEEITEVPVVRVKPLFQHGNAAYVPRLGKLLRGFDIIHLHYPFFGGAEVIWRHARRLKKRGAKIVVHYHMDVVGAGTLARVFALHRTLILPKILEMADRIVVTSLDYARESAVLGPLLVSEPERFVEVPNGVDVTHFVPMPRDAELVDRLQILPTERVIVFVGGLDHAHYFKGIPYLLEALRLLRGSAYVWKLVIVGSGDLQTEYQSLSVQLGIEHLVTFTGYVPYADLPKWYNLATVAVLPSVDRSEAFGMVLVEAMACGKAVIASNLPGVRTVITDADNGILVPIKNAEALARAIDTICIDPELAAAYGQAGLLKARLRYDWRAIARSLDQLYRLL
jgi:glycosyltransferase involved in cell wall biosynthesis